jgi:hypothetical protein
MGAARAIEATGWRASKLILRALYVDKLPTKVTRAKKLPAPVPELLTLAKETRGFATLDDARDAAYARFSQHIRARRAVSY